MLLFISMADSKFILYVRKFLKNPLLARKQVVSTTNTSSSAKSDSNVRVVAWAHPPRNGQRVQEGDHGQARQDP